MMHKLFSYIPVYNETSISVKFIFNDRDTRADITVTASRLSSSADFKKAEENFKDKIENYIKRIKLKNSYVKIEVCGKLNGADISQEFTALDSYHRFLENNNLIYKAAELTH